MEIFVSNLAYSLSDADLEKAFSKFGAVTKARVIMDRDTGRSKGFGFVTMDTGADQAIENLNGSDLMGRKLIVKESENRKSPNQNQNQRTNRNFSRY